MSVSGTNGSIGEPGRSPFRLGFFTRLVDDGVRYLETTITPDNEASIRLFTSFAKRWNTAMETSVLFAGEEFPEAGHLPEELYRIGPLKPRNEPGE